MVMRVHLLGAARVVVDDHTTVPLRSTARDQALAYLAYTGGWTSRDRLGFLFWPDTADQSARHNVRQLLKRIRRLDWLDRLEVDGDVVRWPVRTDVDDMRSAIAAQNWDGLPGEAYLLPGIERNASAEYEDWLLGERRRVRDMWQSAVLAAAMAADDVGTPERGARLLEPLLDDDDGEVVLPRYMELVTRAGDRSSALAAFDRVAARLRDDLGVDPPRQAREVVDRLRSVTAERAAPPPGLVVGRNGEIVEIVGLLMRRHCRLLTLLGPGGIGKSTLARMALSRVATRHPDGGVMVSLETISDPGAIPSRIAAEIGVSLDGRLDPVDQLTYALRDRRLLVVLDNAEHLPAGWIVFSRLLRGCPGVVMLVTSRERLRLDDEWVYEVGGLTDDDGVELFRQRARRTSPDATVTWGEALGVCRAVGGAPLGIELAAPWLRVIPATEIVRQITTDPRVLSGGLRDGTGRYQSVEAAMAHSWALASAVERAAIEALSVFAAPYTRALAATVADVSPLVLRALADKSLIHRRSDDRYASHPLVRQYAAARLSADGDRRREVRTRHARVILGMLEPPDRALEHLDLLDDSVTAWAHAVDRVDLGLVRRAVEGLVNLLDAAGRYGQGLGLLESAASALAACHRADLATVAAVKRGESVLLDRLGRHAEAVGKAREAVAAAAEAGERRLLVLALLSLAWARKTIDGDEAQYAVTREALPVAESLGDDPLVVKIRNGLGCSAPTLTECREHLVQGLRLATAANLADLRTELLCNLGAVSCCLGDADLGRRYLEEGLALARSAGRLPRIVEYLSDLAFFHAETGDLDVAQDLSAEAEDLLAETESMDQKIYTLLVAGEIRRLVDDRPGAWARSREAMRLANAVGNESLALRSLRLHGQLLIDAGKVDDGLRALAVVIAGPTRKGDFTSEIVNPRVWATRTAGVDPRRVQRARAWASGRSPGEVVGSILGRTTS